jgi:hypothetical protein
VEIEMNKRRFTAGVCLLGLFLAGLQFQNCSPQTYQSRKNSLAAINGGAAPQSNGHGYGGMDPDHPNLGNSGVPTVDYIYSLEGQTCPDKSVQIALIREYQQPLSSRFYLLRVDCERIKTIEVTSEISVEEGSLTYKGHTFPKADPN